MTDTASEHAHEKPADRRPPAASKTAFTVLFVTVFLDFLGFTIVLPYLYFQVEALGGSTFDYGLLILIFALMQLIFVPVLGRASDRFGRRRVILLGLAGSAVSFTVFGLAGSVWLLFVARAVAGITDSTFSVAQAYVADTTSKDKRLAAMGLLGAATGLGMVVGPAIGGTLAQLYGFAVPSLFAAALAGGNFAVAYFKLPETRPAADAARRSAWGFLREAAGHRTLRDLFVASFTANLAFAFLDVALPPWLAEAFGFGPLEAGLIFLYAGIINAATQGVALPRLNRRFSPEALLVVGLGLIAVSFVGMGAVAWMPMALAAGGVLMVGAGLAVPSLFHLISVNTRADDQGGMMGVSQSVGSLARVVAPSMAVPVYAAGLTFGVVGLPFLVAGAISVVPFVLLFGLAGRAAAPAGQPSPIEALEGSAA